MLRKLTLFLVALVALVVIAYVITSVWDRSQHEPETQAVTLVEEPDLRPLRLLIPAERDGSPSLSLCEYGTCREVARPAVPRHARTDGTWWYYYASADSEGVTDAETDADVASDEPDDQPQPSDPTGEELWRQHGETNERELITSSTRLVQPRGLWISPNGKRLAYWLDNVGEPSKRLTELWVYDTDEGSTRLLAEGLFRPDVRSEVRWNSSSSALFVVVNSASRRDRDDQLELAVIDANTPGIETIIGIDPAAVHSSVRARVIDLSFGRDNLAYVKDELFGQRLITRTGSGEKTISVRGSVSLVQWLEDNSLLYVVQDKNGFTVWRQIGEINRFVARRSGTALSFRSDVTGTYLASASRHAGVIQLEGLHIESGRVVEQGVVQHLGVIAYAEVLPLQDSPETNAEHFTDDIIAGFVDTNLIDMVGHPAAIPVRMVITDQPNTVFLDYRLETNAEPERILIAVNDVIHTEWAIKGRYEAAGARWNKVQGGSSADPVPVRLYEWEDEIKQWILKSEERQGS